MGSGLIECFVDALNREGIRYCHWKGSFTLGDVLSGEKDFDVLVDRKSAARVSKILAELNFKRASTRPGDAPDAVTHYFGVDPETTELHHVHLYTSLFTGETFFDSHWLPFEEMLLGNTTCYGNVRVPVKPAELISQVLRYFIKYGSLVDLLHVTAKESEEKRAELLWLAEGVDEDCLREMLARYCPMVDERLFRECVEAATTPSPLLKKVRIAREVRRRLRSFETTSAVERWLAYGPILWREGARRAMRKPGGKTLSSGGAIVAFVGPEATGKSTLSAESARWLGRHFRVRVIHAGKPPSSWLTAPANSFLPFVRRVLPDLRTNSIEGHIPSSRPDAPRRRSGLPALLRSIRAVGVAWDRRRLLRQARRAASKGEIVFSDRYPSDTLGAMDSARLKALPGQKGLLATLCNRLAWFEHRLYREIPPPDVAIQLRVPVEVAIQRNRERFKLDKESDAYVESRHRQSGDWRRAGTRYVLDVDTGESLAETILCVKRRIWEVL